jgi:hypothetical protein
MDELTHGAVVSAPFADPLDAERWFQLVADHVGELEETASWADARDALRSGAGSSDLAWAAEAVTDYLDSRAGDPMQVLRDLADPDNRNEYVAASCAAAVAEGPAEMAVEGASYGDATGTGQADTVPFDDGAWYEYLQRWQGQWDGTEEGWQSFRESFAYWAPDGTRDAARQLIEQAEGSDKAATLAPYGIVAAAPADAPAGPALEDSASADLAADLPATGTGPAEADVRSFGDDAEAEEVIAGLLQDRPEFAALGAERLQELYAEVIAELDVVESSARE